MRKLLIALLVTLTGLAVAPPVQAQEEPPSAAAAAPPWMECRKVLRPFAYYDLNAAYGFGRTVCFEIPHGCWQRSVVLFEAYMSADPDDNWKFTLKGPRRWREGRISHVQWPTEWYGHPTYVLPLQIWVKVFCP